MTRSREEVIVRKYRKKIRQIERLERLERELTDDEIDKVLQKDELREQLQAFVTALNEQVDTKDNIANQNFILNQFDISLDGDSVSTELSEYGREDDSVGLNTSFTQQIKDISLDEDVMKRSLDTSESTDKADEKTSTPIAQAPVSDVPAKKPKAAPKQPKPSAGGKGEISKEAPPSTSQLLQRKWRKSKYRVNTLEGHNDYICCLDTDGTVLVTGSRDTMIKLWELDTGIETRSLGGHTGTVTCVMLLPHEAAKCLADEIDPKTDRLIVSGSQDSSIRIWSYLTGREIKSIYTYNAVTCLTFIQNGSILVSSSDGGKIQLYSLETGTNLQSIQPFDESVTCLRMAANKIYAGSKSGLIKIFDIRDGQLFPIYVMEDPRSKCGNPLCIRSIHCLSVHNDTVYYGDEGVNIKALDWKAGMVHKVVNHLTEFGCTDAIYVHQDTLLSTGYDLDNALGYLNVRSLPGEKYLASFCDLDTSRIMCTSMSRTRQGRMVMATGGAELKIWIEVDTGSASDEDVYGAYFIPQYERTPHNSDQESEDEEEESHLSADDNVSPFTRQEADGQEDEEGQTNNGWLGSCTVL